MNTINPNNREHPADFKAREILTTLMSTKCTQSENKIMKNNKNQTSPTLSSASSLKSSINLDVCYELDHKKSRNHSNRDAIIKQHEKYNCNNNIFNKVWNVPASVDVELHLGCEKELYFIRAITWMKSAVQIMKEVSQNDIQKIFKDLKKTTNLKNSSTSSSLSCSLSNTASVKNPQIMQTLQLPISSLLNGHIVGKRILDNCNSDDDSVMKKQYRIPDEETYDPMSPLVSFCENFESECVTNNNSRHNEDSGFLSRDQINNEMKSMSETRDSWINRHQDNGLDNQFEYSDETISSASLSSIIEALRLNNFVIGEVRIILRVLENNETAQNYKRNGSAIHDAISIIVQFLNQLVTEDDMSSSGVYLQLCTKNIMTTIKKIFNGKLYRSLTSAARQNQLMTILGFCNCRKICEETIDLIINSLTDLMENMTNVNLDEYAENQPLMIYDDESHLLCRILPVVVKKYVDIVGSSRNINVNSHYYTTYVWRKLWKNHEHYDVSEFRSKELEIDWATRLEKLIDPQLPVGRFSIFGDYNTILISIKMLSTLTLNRDIK